MALRVTQPLTEMSTRNLPGGKGCPARIAGNLTAICEPIVSKMCQPRRLTNLWIYTACYSDKFTFLYETHKYTPWKKFLAFCLLTNHVVHCALYGYRKSFNL
jgi:hypothetical protein